MIKMSKQTDVETAGKRFTQDLDKPVNGFRKGITRRDILKSLDDNDWKRIDEIKYYQQFDKDSITAKIVLQNDTVRADRDTKIDNILEMINHIRNVITTNERKQEQVDTGKITEELKEGILMNKQELEFEILAGSRIIKNTLRRIVKELGMLRNLVGSHDLLGNEIMSEKKYDEFVIETEKTVKKLGFDLFDNEINNNKK